MVFFPYDQRPERLHVRAAFCQKSGPNMHCRNHFEQIDQAAYSAIQSDSVRMDKAVKAAVEKYVSTDDYDLTSTETKNYLDDELDYFYSVINLENATIDE